MDTLEGIIILLDGECKFLLFWAMQQHSLQIDFLPPSHMCKAVVEDVEHIKNRYGSGES